jgi:NhaA family Na+:H+ antiporter
MQRRVDEDIAEGKRNGVTGTPTLFVDDLRYDGAWDFYSMLEALERPVAARVQRSARVFASLPASGGLVLILAAAAALICANSPLAPYYRSFVDSSFTIGPVGGPLSLTVGTWFSEGLLAFFFLLVGLEIRRELTAGALTGLAGRAVADHRCCGRRACTDGDLSHAQPGADRTGMVRADCHRHRFCARYSRTPG